MKVKLVQAMKYVVAAVIGAILCLGGWDYYITRQRAFNGQQAFEYLVKLQQAQEAQQKAKAPAQPMEAAPPEVKK